MVESERSQSATGITDLSVVGAGTMGSGIALAALYAGWRVRLFDASAQVLERAVEYVSEYLARKSMADARQNLSLHQSMEELAPAQLWIEAVPEKLDLKRKLFAEMDQLANPRAILATNTSTLSVAAIASSTRHPERVFGLHFFNPAAVMPLVEVVATDTSDPELLELATACVKELGKTPVTTADSPGFIVNRVARPFYSEALQLLTEGLASIEQVDRLVEGVGFPMGPFRLMDFIGNDVNYAATTSVYEQTSKELRYKPHLIQQGLVQAGQLGRKSGRGFYRYPMDWPELEPLKAQRAELAEQNVYLAAASMAPGLPELLLSLGVEPSQEPERATVAIVAAMEPEAQRAEVAELEASLPEQALLLCQTVTGPLSSFMEAATRPDRIVGFDSLLAAPAEVVSLVAAPGAGRAGKKRAAGFFRALGKRVEWVNDAAGQVLPRILAMLVNEAAFCLQQGTASADDIDRAMELGVRYPRGPLAWGRQLGFERVVAVLEALHRGQQGRRYRAAELLRRWAQGSREGLS